MERETAKAAQEVAKTAGRAIDAAEKLGGFLRKVVGGALIELGGTLQDWSTLQDWTRYIRYKNLLSIQDRVEMIHAARQVQGEFLRL